MVLIIMVSCTQNKQNSIDYDKKEKTRMKKGSKRARGGNFGSLFQDTACLDLLPFYLLYWNRLKTARGGKPK